MGLCASTPKLTVAEATQLKIDKDRNKALEKVIVRAKADDLETIKLLLLGAGESGKSTLFKQMIHLYGSGYSDDALSMFVPIVHNNVITTMKTLCVQSAIYAPIVDPVLLHIKHYIENDIKEDERISENIAENIHALWIRPEIQQTYKHRAHYNLTDSAAYFNDKVLEIGSDDYLPTKEDVLRSRVRTTGIVENEFVIDDNTFRMFDVGGQRTERKKWIHCFEGVTAVLFVASLSEYDQVLAEDENTNRVVEALNLFDEVCNSRWFKDTSIILFLNKRDLFAEKLEQVPLDLYFPAFRGGRNYKMACEFMKNEFESKNRNKEKTIYTHVCCATDTSNVSAVFGGVKDICIFAAMKTTDMM